MMTNLQQEASKNRITTDVEFSFSPEDGTPPVCIKIHTRNRILDPDRIRAMEYITGHELALYPSYDELPDRLKNELCKELNLDPSNLEIIVNTSRR
jgi:hypothetical protein